ncbi:MAG: hypothetical protein AAFY60_15020 [Myxococcota bacterium]
METLRNELNEALLDLVGRVQKAVDAQREARYASLGIEASDGEALARLASFPGGLSGNDWGELCELSSRQTQALTRRVIQGGWVERVKKGRKSLLVLTDDGSALVERARSATLGLFHRPLKELRLEELRVLVASLNRVLHALKAPSDLEPGS